MIIDGTQYYTLKDLEPIIGVKAKTMWTYIKDGRMKARKIGRRWVVSEHDLKNFMDRGTR